MGKDMWAKDAALCEKNGPLWAIHQEEVARRRAAANPVPIAEEIEIRNPRDALTAVWFARCGGIVEFC